MARKRNAVNENTLELLKHFVKAKSNLDCSSFAQIHKLQQDIQHSTGTYLSLQTLNRLFGIIRTGFNPSVHTLNTLAAYVDYKSFQEFEILNIEKLPEDVQISFASKFILSVFSSITPEDNMQAGVLPVMRNVVKLIAEDRQLASEVYYGMAPPAFGRKYFFEQFINMDGLDHAYGNGLQYYLLNAESREQKFFAYTLYCYRYFLTGRHALFREYFNLLHEFRQSEIMAFQPMLIDRYYAVLVFNQSIRKTDMDDDATLTSDMMDFDMLSSHARSFYSAGYLVGEALLLTGEFDKAWQILNKGEKLIAPDGLLQEDRTTYIDILRLSCGFYSANISVKRTQTLLDEIQGRKLPALSGDYLSLLLLFLKRSIQAKPQLRKEISAQIPALIQKTGFHYMHKYDLLLDTSASIIF